MKILSLIFGGLAAVVVLASCGNHVYHPPKPATETERLGVRAEPAGKKIETITEELLNGQWESDCVINPKLQDAFIRQVVKVVDAEVSVTTIHSREATCAAEFYRTETQRTSTIQTGSDTASSKTVKNTWFQIQKTMEVTPVAPLAVASFNTGTGFCGRTDWKTQTPIKMNDLSECGLSRLLKQDIELYVDSELSTLKVFFCELKGDDASTDACEVRFWKTQESVQH